MYPGMYVPTWGIGGGSHQRTKIRFVTCTVVRAAWPCWIVWYHVQVFFVSCHRMVLRAQYRKCGCLANCPPQSWRKWFVQSFSDTLCCLGSSKPPLPVGNSVGNSLIAIFDPCSESGVPCTIGMERNWTSGVQHFEADKFHGCSNMEVRDKTTGVEVCRRLTITILSRALVLPRINLWGCEIKQLLYHFIINLDIWAAESWVVFSEVSQPLLYMTPAYMEVFKCCCVIWINRSPPGGRWTILHSCGRSGRCCWRFWFLQTKLQQWPWYLCWPLWTSQTVLVIVRIYWR